MWPFPANVGGGRIGVVPSIEGGERTDRVGNFGLKVGSDGSVNGGRSLGRARGGTAAPPTGAPFTCGGPLLQADPLATDEDVASSA